MRRHPLAAEKYLDGLLGDAGLSPAQGFAIAAADTIAGDIGPTGLFLTAAFGWPADFKAAISSSSSVSCRRLVESRRPSSPL